MIAQDDKTKYYIDDSFRMCTVHSTFSLLLAHIQFTTKIIAKATKAKIKRVSHIYLSPLSYQFSSTSLTSRHVIVDTDG